MDSKSRAWREQERQLIERWNAASERHRAAQVALAVPTTDGIPLQASVQAAKAAREELDQMRKQVARLKSEFSTGKRY
jgi:hypothetical protein